MKKITTVIAAAAAALALLSGCGAPAGQPTPGGESAPAEAKVIRAGSTGQSFPNGFKDGDKLVGFDVEMLEEAAKRGGYKVEWTTADFAGLMGMLESGRLDTVANNVAITAARKETYNFTDVYAYMGTSIVTYNDSAIEALTDLDGKTVAGVLGSNNLKTLEAWAAEKNITVTVRPFETRDGAQLDLINKRVDAYVQSRGILLAEIAKENLPLRIVGDLGVDEIGLPFRKDDAGDVLLKEINTQIGAMRADGALQTLSEKYFGTDVTVPPSNS